MIDRRIAAGLTVALGLVVIVAWIALRGEDDDPEAQIRATLQRAVEAVERKDLGGVMEVVSERFESGELTRDRVKGILFMQLQRNDWGRVFLTDTAVELIQDDHAEVKTAAVLAGGERVEALRDVAPARASVYRFELELRKEEDEWRVTSAQYRRARWDELIVPE